MSKYDRAVFLAPAIGDIEFCDWLAASKPGDAIQYHAGLLAYDTWCYADAPPELKALCARLSRVAATALQSANRGLVALVQKRYGDFDFGYFAVRLHSAFKAREAA